jgi:hypothetical protein
MFRDAPSRKRKNQLSIYADAAIRHCHRHLYDYSCPRRRPPLATGMKPNNHKRKNYVCP